MPGLQREPPGCSLLHGGWGGHAVRCWAGPVQRAPECLDPRPPPAAGKPHLRYNPACCWDLRPKTLKDLEPFTLKTQPKRAGGQGEVLDMHSFKVLRTGPPGVPRLPAPRSTPVDISHSTYGRHASAHCILGPAPVLDHALPVLGAHLFRIEPALDHPCASCDIVDLTPEILPRPHQVS